MNEPSGESAADFAARRDQQRRRQFARRPKKIADVVAQLVAKRGYGRIDADKELAAAWRAAAGEPLAAASRPGKIRRGQLEVLVANSTILQEFGFHKQRIVTELNQTLANANIRGLRLRVGRIN
jgi:hypothetical protein